MLCSQCHGKHLTMIDGQVRPCEECGGLGEVHCCEGLQAQPEADCPAVGPGQAECDGAPNRGRAP